MTADLRIILAFALLGLARRIAPSDHLEGVILRKHASVAAREAREACA